jgi:hypothetical protein
MHPLLKDAFKIQIETGASVKTHFHRSHEQLARIISGLRQEVPGFKEGVFNSDLMALSEDLEGGIEMLEMLCDEMNRLFEFIPESEECL